jgi:uncharacterized protein
MKCPVCKEPDLVMTHRQDIEIDYCPQCRGIWLDRGELDKIVERSESLMADGRSAPPPDRRYPTERRRDDDDDYKRRYGKKRGGLLGELFDF